MKKVISLIVAVMMIMALIATPAFAAGEGSIQIDNIVEGNVYSIYQLLDLESYNVITGAYSYKVNPTWNNFFSAGGEGLNYVKIDEAGYVTWNASDDDTIVAEFAQKALKYAKDNGITPLKSSANTGDFTVSGTSGVFSGLDLGYYLVDSSMGALCGLTTTSPNATITAKNAKPTLIKYVQEDSLSSQADQGWRSTNTADMGQEVNFMVSIDVHDGAENFVLHDTMADGITFDSVTKIQHVIPGTGTHDAETTKYEVVTTGITDGCTFHIVFSEEFCNDLNKNDKITIYYTSTLNTSAVVGSEGNKNTAWLTFGDTDKDHSTEKSETTTYTYGVDIVKTTSTGLLLNGAEFKLYDALTGGNQIYVVWDAAKQVYRRAVSSDDSSTFENIVISVANNGTARVEGLDNGTYYLEETKAPDGYNKLTARHAFTVSDANFDAARDDANQMYLHSGVQVINKTGSILPTTGGIGTTIFVTLGGLTVLAAGVVLFAKKRMSQIAE